MKRLKINRDTLRTLASGIPDAGAPYTTDNCTFGACSVHHGACLPPARRAP